MTVRQGAPKPTGFASTSGPRYERSTVQHFRRSSIVQRAPKATLKPNGTNVFARNVVIAKRSRGNGGDGKEVRPSTPSLLPITPPPPPPPQPNPRTPGFSSRRPAQIGPRSDLRDQAPSTASLLRLRLERRSLSSPRLESASISARDLRLRRFGSGATTSWPTPKCSRPGGKTWVSLTGTRVSMASPPMPL